MAERRMFHSAVVESDAFLELPIGSQALYFHLGMHADDDGFVNGAKRVCNALGRRIGELQRLIDAGFLLNFNGIIVLKHWRMANVLRNTRAKPLRYPHIAAKLFVMANREYSLESQQFSTTLYDLRQQILADKCQPKGTEENRTEENITEENRSEENTGSAGDGPFGDTLAYIQHLQAQPPAERDDP